MAASLSFAAVLRGRGDQCAQLDGLLDRAREGHSGVLMLSGEAGVGKTALLEYAIASASASALTVVRVAGIESEMELAFAALQQLCGPMLDRLERVPARQRDALETAFGLGPGAVPDRFLVGLAVMSLLSEVTQERPLLCVVDDAQWLDQASAQTLAFVARRMLAEPVVLLFAAREPSDPLAGLPELALAGLADADARELLSAVLPVVWTGGSPTRSSLRRGETPWRCWSSHGGSAPGSWRAASGCPARCRCPEGSRAAS